VKQGNQKERVGEVISSKMNKTIVVEVPTPLPACPVQENRSLPYKKFYAHDEKNEAKPGDRVRIG